MLNPIINNQIVRNYIIAATSVMLMSMGVADMFNNPQRIAQQAKLEGYAPYISAGLVSYGKNLAR